MTGEERERLGKTAELAYNRAMNNVDGWPSSKIPEVWARTAEAVAEAVAVPLLAEIAALRAEVERLVGLLDAQHVRLPTQAGEPMAWSQKGGGS